MAVTSSERKVIRIVKSLKEANKWQVADRMGVSPDYAEYLLKQLVLGGYLTQTTGASVSRRYRTTSAGEEAASKTWDQPSHMPAGLRL